MRRRRRGVPTQLARAGERTQLLVGDSPLSKIRFKATVFDGVPAGRINIETVDGTRTEPLGEDNLLDIDGLISLSVVPERDTTMTLAPVNRVRISPAVIGGALLVAGAIGLTFWDLLS